MKIITAQQAATLLQNVVDALNQLTVKGRENCYIVAASINDIDLVSKFLADENERKDNQHESNQP